MRTNHSKAIPFVLLTLASCGGGGGGSAPSNPQQQTAPAPEIPTSGVANQLAIPGSFQQTAVWCWAAVAEMVFRYYGVPNVNPVGNYQCGIVAVSFGGVCLQNCGLQPCVATAGNAANYLGILTNYAERLATFGINSPDVDAFWVASPLTFDEVRAEIDQGRPIVCGISPGAQFVLPGSPMHAILVTGYYQAPGVRLVVLNDPFPYGFQSFTGNPYVSVGTVNVAPGKYVITYESLVGGLQWSDSFVGVSSH